MSKLSNADSDSVREKLIGLGEKSIKKSHYPELKARMHQMERFHALLDEANDAIILADAQDLVLVDVNATAQRMLGRDHGELVGMKLADLLPHPQGERLARFIVHREPDEDRFPEIEAELLRPDGTTTAVGMTVTIHTFAGQDYAVAVARDVSERKVAEERIRRLNRELEQRVVKRTAQLNEIIRELDAFTFSVSHDLRAPLRTIEGFSRIIQEDYGDGLEEQAQQYLQRIIRGVRRMDELISDLLHLSRVNRKDMELKPVDLTCLAREVYSDLTQVMLGRDVHFIVAEDMRAKADPGLMRVLFSNLIGNALKFTSKKQRARIEVGEAETEHGPTFFVRDNGVGFDPAYADKLFTAFKRLHSSSDFEGTGIGLAIVKRVVERHGGRVWGESEPDAGATIFFTLSGD